MTGGVKDVKFFKLSIMASNAEVTDTYVHSWSNE